LGAVWPTPIYGGTGGRVYADDDSTWDDVGVAVDAWWDSKDFVYGDSYKRTTTRWMELNFEACGDTVSVYYSVDGGLSYVQLNGGTAVTLTQNWKSYKLDYQLSSNMVRFRFRNNSSEEYFKMRWLEVGFIPQSDRGRYEFQP